MFAAPLVFIPATYFHSRESGNLPESLTVFWHRAPKQLDDREIPAFAGMGGGRDGEIQRTSIPAKAGISAAKPHSPKATIAMFRFAENSRCCENEIPAFAGMESGGRFSLSREWEGGGTAKLKELPFRRKPESLRRSRIRRRRPLQCSALRKILAVARMRFRLSPEWKVGGDFRLPLILIPAKAGISLSSFCNLRRWRGNREIPAFAGMG